MNRFNFATTINEDYNLIIYSFNEEKQIWLMEKDNNYYYLLSSLEDNINFNPILIDLNEGIKLVFEYTEDEITFSTLSNLLN